MSRRIVLCCPFVTDGFDTYGLRSLRRYVTARLDFAVSFQEVRIQVAEDVETAAARLLAADPDLVGISTFVWNERANLSIADRLKQMSPQTPVVLGGPQVSDPTYDVLGAGRSVDFVVRGEGEETFTDVLAHWNGSGSLPDLNGIAGISFRGADGRTIHNLDRAPLSNLDDVPSLYDGLQPLPSVTYGLETTRGCYCHCAYCLMGQRPFRCHSLEYATAEVRHMANAGLRSVNILDNSFTFDGHRLAAIAGCLRQYGIRYSCCARAEELSADVVETLADTGVTSVEIGLQAVHARTVEMMGRPPVGDRFRENVARLIRRGHSAGFKVMIDAIAGLPGDNFDTFCQTMDFAYALRPDEVAAFPLQLLPGTDFYHRAGSLGIECSGPGAASSSALGRYGLHRHNMVVATASFPRAEVEQARRLCLLNGVLRDAGVTPLIYTMLDAEQISFSSWIARFGRLLAGNIFDELQAIGTDPAARGRVWVSLREALARYGAQSHNASVKSGVEAWLRRGRDRTTGHADAARASSAATGAAGGRT